VPANRSRTSEWRRCLKQVWERGGALEIAVAQRDQQAPSPDLVWRVRLLGLTEQEILVEKPVALGQVIQLERGIELVVILSIGQNRWMFTTTNLGEPTVRSAERTESHAIRLAMPQEVQRCQRRQHYRVDAVGLNLPTVDIWPLLDPKTVLVAERACEIQAEPGDDNARASMSAGDDLDLVMPEVGPRFTAQLVNLGGGGVGLRVRPQDSQALAHHKMFWMRIALPSTLHAPICATAKLVHTHMESNHDTYAGLAFDFSFNPAHQRFVADQICQCIARQQQAQSRREQHQHRKIARAARVSCTRALETRPRPVRCDSLGLFTDSHARIQLMLACSDKAANDAPSLSGDRLHAHGRDHWLGIQWHDGGRALAAHARTSTAAHCAD